MALGSTEPAPDSKALALIAHEHLRDVCIYIFKTCFLVCLLLYKDVSCQMSNRDLLNAYKLFLRRLSDYTADVSDL